MIGHATGGGGPLLQGAEPRRGLAGIEHAAPRACDGGGVGARGGCDAAQALEEVEDDAFALEEGAGAASDVGEDFAIVAGIAIALEDVEFLDAAAEGVDFGEE